MSIFQHPPFFNKRTQNLYYIPAIAFALAMIFLWLYIPQLQQVLRTAQVPAEHFFIPMTFGLFLPEQSEDGPVPDGGGIVNDAGGDKGPESTETPKLRRTKSGTLFNEEGELVADDTPATHEVEFDYLAYAMGRLVMFRESLAELGIQAAVQQD